MSTVFSPDDGHKIARNM